MGGVYRLAQRLRDDELWSRQIEWAIVDARRRGYVSELASDYLAVLLDQLDERQAEWRGSDG